MCRTPGPATATLACHNRNNHHKAAAAATRTPVPPLRTGLHCFTSESGAPEFASGENSLRKIKIPPARFLITPVGWVQVQGNGCPLPAAFASRLISPVCDAPKRAGESTGEAMEENFSDCLSTLAQHPIHRWRSGPPSGGRPPEYTDRMVEE